MPSGGLLAPALCLSLSFYIFLRVVLSSSGPMLLSYLAYSYRYSTIRTSSLSLWTISSFHDINPGISLHICFRISAHDLDDLYTSRTGEGNHMHMKGTGQPAFFSLSCVSQTIVSPAGAGVFLNFKWRVRICSSTRGRVSSAYTIVLLWACERACRL